MRASGLGGEIDAHDVVVRVNNAKLSGYAADVGSRTDVRVAWGAGMRLAQQQGLVGPEQILVARNFLWSEHDDAMPDDLVRLNNRWIGWLHVHLLDHHSNEPSTGFDALAMAVALARHVGAPPPSVYGFGQCLPCSKYYTCSRMPPSPARIEAVPAMRHRPGSKR